MTTATIDTFASPGARAEHYLIGSGAVTDSLGRVVRGWMQRFHARRASSPRITVVAMRESERMREQLRSAAELLRLRAARPAF
jgi:hypothetical protein